MLNTLTPDASKCCARQWRKIDEEKLASMSSFICDKCGCEYRPRVEGEIRFWDGYEWASLIKAAL